MNKEEYPAGEDARIRYQCASAVERLGLTGVKVLVSRGWVSLMGSVPQGSDRWRAEEAVGLVEGVTGVNGQLSVKP